MDFRISIIAVFCFFLVFSSNCKGQDNKVQVTSKAYDVMLNSLLTRDVAEVGVATLSVMDKDVILLDAREQGEYEVSHLEGARYIGYDLFEMESVSDINKDEEIVVYCSVGYRSEQITRQLQQAGYKNVSNLYGGLFEWKNTGHTVVDMENQSTEAVHAYDRVWGLWLSNGKKVY